EAVGLGKFPDAHEVTAGGSVHRGKFFARKITALGNRSRAQILDPREQPHRLGSPANDDGHIDDFGRIRGADEPRSFQRRAIAVRENHFFAARHRKILRRDRRDARNSNRAANQCNPSWRAFGEDSFARVDGFRSCQVRVARHVTICCTDLFKLAWRTQMRLLRDELGPMVRLAAPIVAAELGWMGMAIVDTMMVGRLPYSAVAIGAVSLGSIVFLTMGIFGTGLMLGLD